MMRLPFNDNDYKQILLTTKGENMDKQQIINLLVDLLKETKSENKNDFEKGKYVIVRTYSAGVFAGNIESRNGQEVVLLKARRIWYWDGAASLSQLATEGTKLPENCKFPCEVPRIELLNAIEILDVSEKAEKSIKGVPIWSK